MTTYQVSMHQGGSLVTLEAILEAIDGDGLERHLVDIDAISKRNSGLDVLFLERESRSKQGGLVLTDTALRALASQLDQVIDCQIFGVSEGQPFQVNGPDVVGIVASDSTEWIVRVEAMHRDRLDPASSLFEKS